MNNELKPCPFCGNNRVRLRTHNYGHGITTYTVRCKTKGNKCLIKPITQAYSTKEQAIKAWNTRPDIEKQERENPQPLTLEQLKERVGKPVWYCEKDTKEKALFIPMWVYDTYMLAFCIRKRLSYTIRQYETIESFNINETDFYDHEPKGV